MTTIEAKLLLGLPTKPYLERPGELWFHPLTGEPVRDGIPWECISVASDDLRTGDVVEVTDGGPQARRKAAQVLCVGQGGERWVRSFNPVTVSA